MTHPASAQPSTEWKKLNQEGNKQLQEKHYEEAITAFKAANELNPSADKLEKIATAYKGLNKTPEAIATLEKMLEQFGPTLPAEKRKAVKDDIEKMRADLATLQVTVTPAEAAVSIDGDVLPPGATAGPIKIASGKHTISARLDGYEQGVRAVDLPAGSKATVVELKLVPNKAFVSVRAQESDLYISLDSTVVGRGVWSGLVAPGRHLVQIYRPAGPS